MYKLYMTYYTKSNHYNADSKTLNQLCFQVCNYTETKPVNKIMSTSTL